MPLTLKVLVAHNAVVLVHSTLVQAVSMFDQLINRVEGVTTAMSWATEHGAK